MGGRLDGARVIVTGACRGIGARPVELAGRGGEDPGPHVEAAQWTAA